jgi:hypothetical protein
MAARRSIQQRHHDGNHRARDQDQTRNDPHRKLQLYRIETVVGERREQARR